jgi:hypothetical protein
MKIIASANFAGAISSLVGILFYFINLMLTRNRDNITLYSWGFYNKEQWCDVKRGDLTNETDNTGQDTISA